MAREKRVPLVASFPAPAILVVGCSHPTDETLPLHEHDDESTEQEPVPDADEDKSDRAVGVPGPPEERNSDWRFHGERAKPLPEGKFETGSR
jgi:hypothetical protein